MKAKIRFIQSIVLMGVWLLAIFGAPRTTVHAAPANGRSLTTTVLSVSSDSSDPDQDGLNNAQEKACGTNPKVADSNHNGINDGADDKDHDGVSNKAEFEHKTKCAAKDSDQDGLSDGKELSLGTNPLKKDSDGDGLSDRQEVEKHTNPLNKDSDGDGVTDKSDKAPDDSGHH